MDSKQRAMAQARAHRDVAEILAAEMFSEALTKTIFKPGLEDVLRADGFALEDVAEIVAEKFREHGGAEDADALMELAGICRKWSLTWRDVDHGRKRVAELAARKKRETN